MADIDARWYVIQTYSGYERKVAERIRTLAKNSEWKDRIIDAYVPVETVKKITPGSGYEVGDEASDADAQIDVSGSAKKSTSKSKTQKDETERPIFSGYVFVKLATKVGKADEKNDEEDDEFKIDNDVWYRIRTTNGVTGFVGPEGKLVPLDKEDLIKFKIEQFEEEEEVTFDEDFFDPSMDYFNNRQVIELDYKVGDRVKLLNMPGFSGVVKEIDIEHNMVIVVGSMFGGRETPVEIELDQVELVED